MLSRYEEAFGRALNRGDLGTVAWLCRQADPVSVLAGGGGPGLSQGVLLSLVQQLGSDLSQARPVLPGLSHDACMLASLLLFTVRYTV